MDLVLIVIRIKQNCRKEQQGQQPSQHHSFSPAWAQQLLISLKQTPGKWAPAPLASRSASTSGHIPTWMLQSASSFTAWKPRRSKGVSGEGGINKSKQMLEIIRKGSLPRTKSIIMPLDLFLQQKDEMQTPWAVVLQNCLIIQILNSANI